MISDETNSFVIAPEESPLTPSGFTHEQVAGFLSVIIPVYKDVEGLDVTLRSLETQTLPRSRYEILVANDGADPGISELCHQMHVHEIPLPVNRGSYAARNAALAAARGEFIGFADADIRAEPDWAEAGMNALASADLAAGKTIIDIGEKRSAVELYQFCFAFPADAYVRESGMAQTVNLFARRQLFAEIGFFDDRLRSGGDLEWSSRATRRGKTLVFAEAARVYHPPRNYAQLLGSAERILYGQLASQRLHRGNVSLLQTASKSAWRLLAPPAPRSMKWMRNAGLSAAEFVKVYFLAWWLKARSLITLSKVRRALKKNPPFAAKLPFHPKVSIIINNFNYARFLPACIESVLAQTYQNCEVIVVDDGSTDTSEAVIRAFGDKVISVLKPNGGQGSAYHAGFQRATGDLVQFLDADDFLATNCIERVVASWRHGVVKAQFHLAIVDEAGRGVGVRTPSGRMTDRRALEMMRLFGAYCSPPASGNVFSSEFLRQILPFPNERELVFAADAPAILAAPYFGEVISVEENLGFYRRHALANASGTLAEFDPATALRRLEEERGRDELRDRSMAMLFAALSERPLQDARSCRKGCQILSERMPGPFGNRRAPSESSVICAWAKHREATFCHALERCGEESAVHYGGMATAWRNA